MEDCIIPDLTLAIVFILVFLLGAYQFSELHYFARLTLCYLRTFVKGKLHVLDTAELCSICLTTDIDYLLFHMNNARYIRELDFARVDFYQRTGLWAAIRDRGGQVYVGATSIRYRRFIKLFARYRYTTRIVYWDQANVYTEHRFVTRGDGFVRAIVYGQQKVVNCNVDEVMAKMLAASSDNGPPKTRQKPECPEEIRLWIESCEVSSKKLRSNS